MGNTPKPRFLEGTERSVTYFPQELLLMIWLLAQSNAHDNAGLLPHANVCKQGHSCLYAWPFAGTSVSSAGGLSTCIRRVSVQAMLPYLTSRHLGYVRAGLMPPFWGRGRREGRSEGGGGIVSGIYHSSLGQCWNFSRHGVCLRSWGGSIKTEFSLTS
jgi:hypothetical protein